jgi:hypothetical protein
VVNSARTAFGPAPAIFPATLDAVVKPPKPPRAPKAIKAAKIPRPKKLPRGRANYPMLPPAS